VGYCGLEYSSRFWADVVIPDDVWKLIIPDGSLSGLLCFNCMNGRLEALGLSNVPYEIASGPFSFRVRTVTPSSED